MPKLDRDELSELGEAYRDNLDAELRPTRASKEIDWGILLSTSEMRRGLALRFRQLSMQERAAVIIVPIAGVLALVWLLVLLVRAIAH